MKIKLLALTLLFLLNITQLFAEIYEANNEKIKGGLYQKNRTIEMCRENRRRNSLRMGLHKINQF